MVFEAHCVSERTGTLRYLRRIRRLGAQRSPFFFREQKTHGQHVRKMRVRIILLVWSGMRVQACCSGVFNLRRSFSEGTGNRKRCKYQILGHAFAKRHQRLWLHIWLQNVKHPCAVCCIRRQNAVNTTICACLQKA